ncbi:hypothetical protein AAFF_G00317340 [Aldrovandia affinis]|uniref:Uncharacterized protein n=1 Tax=Aldrovandia affinis TaxID=143900 RepID=A0AAD7R759_9TELE|nr:hypothetical protein AAFF_G00317340 [Aldrovandia affinis]
MQIVMVIYGHRAALESLVLTGRDWPVLTSRPPHRRGPLTGQVPRTISHQDPGRHRQTVTSAVTPGFLPPPEPDSEAAVAQRIAEFPCYAETVSGAPRVSPPALLTCVCSAQGSRTKALSELHVCTVGLSGAPVLRQRWQAGRLAFEFLSGEGRDTLEGGCRVDVFSVNGPRPSAFTDEAASCCREERVRLGERESNGETGPVIGCRLRGGVKSDARTDGFRVNTQRRHRYRGRCRHHGDHNRTGASSPRPRCERRVCLADDEGF